MICATYTSPVPSRYHDYWDGTTIAGLLERAAMSLPESVAVVDDDVRLTFGDLWQRSCGLAARLTAMGVEKGDVVAVQLPNWWEAFVAYGALAIVGAVCNPLVTMLRERELGFVMRQSRPKVAIVPSHVRTTDFVELHRAVVAALDEPPRVLVVRAGARDVGPFETFDLDGGREAAEPTHPTPVSSQDIALLMYTSGTTADPKGVLHHHDALLYEVRSIVSLFGLRDEDSVFMVSPLSHISGYLFGFMLGAMTGAPTVLLDQWDPRAAVDVIERHRCRFTLAAPVFLRGLVDVYRERGVTSALHTFMCGGADVPADLVLQGRHVLGAEVVRTYGLTEMPTLTSGRPGGGESNITTDGFVLVPAECRIDGDDTQGELLVRGPELFCGYLDPDHNEAFAVDGFFRTGDLARLQPDGSVTILGRSKDVIVRGGEKLSAREVEDLLLGHPDIADVAVVPMRDETLGERVCAFLVPAPGCEPDVPALGAYLRLQGLARQKHPEHVVLVNELPRTASGKVQKHLLRERIGTFS